MKAALLVACLVLSGCCTPQYLYKPIPQNMIPRAPELPTIKSESLQCLSDAAYTALADRDRMLRQDNAELRALLGDGK